jgi:predicted DNA-binding transcriptional regulator YafY
MTVPEAHAILIGAAALQRSGVPSFDDALARAVAKVRALVREAGESGEPATVKVDAKGFEDGDRLSTVARASRERRQVELDYSSIAGQKRRRFVVEPYALLDHRGSWYVLGRSATHAEDRVFVFKVERIRGARLLEQTFDLPRDFDVRDYTRESIFVAGLRPVAVKLRLRGATARRIGEWYQKKKRGRNGSVVVERREVVTGWLAAWLLRQGAEVEVIAPPALAERVKNLAKNVAAAHSS